MPKIIENRAVLLQPLKNRPRYDDGSPVRKFFQPKAVEAVPEPKPIVAMPPDMGAVVNAIRELEYKIDSDPIIAAIQELGSKMETEPAKPRSYEFTVTQRDEYGKVLKFTVTEKE